MNPDDCYSQLFSHANEIVSFLRCLSTSTKLPWEEHFGFQAIPIDSEWIKKEHMLSQVNEVQPIKQLGLLKIPPKSFYNWHVDDYRQSCINLLISENFGRQSITVFGKEKNGYYHDNIIELKYMPSTYYLFNNQVKHSVLNLDDKDRYLLSLYFEEELPYEVVRDKMERSELLFKADELLAM